MIHRLLIRLCGNIVGPLALTVALAVAINATWLGQAIATGLVLGRIIDGATTDEVVGPLIVIASLIGVRAALSFAREVAVQRTAASVKTRIRRRLLERLDQLGPGYVIRSRAGATQALVVDAIENLEAYYGRYLPQLVTTTFTVLAAIAYLAVVDWVVAVVLAVVALAVPTVPRLWDKLFLSAGNSHWRAYEELSADYVDAMQGMTTLKTYNAAEARLRALDLKAWEIYLTGRRYNALSMIDGGITALGQALGAAIAVVVGAARVWSGDLDIGGLFLVLMVSAEAFRPYRELALYWHAGYLGFSVAESLEGLLKAPADVTEQPDAVPLTLDSTPPDITFAEVSFTYPDRTTAALEGVTFAVEAGTTTAIVGRSGSGKTTVVSLLARFFDPMAGTIRIGGSEIAATTLESLRSLIAVVSQDTHLFHGTIAENLRIARPDATADQLRDAAAMANVLDDIAGFPEAFDTLVGERGLTLSGGQRQRIAIARAILKDAPILILDEATSSVDARNETAIVSAMTRLAEGRTTLVIAHRLSTIRDADQIIVLADGKVAERGTHADLERNGGAYARLIAAQHLDAEPKAGPPR